MAMRLPSRLRHTWRSLFDRGGLDADLDRELAAYADELVRRRMESGESAEAARRAVAVTIASVESIKAGVRPERAGAGALAWWDDGADAWRSLRRARGFTAVVVFILGLGIGAATGIFSAVYALLIKPLPYPDSDRLVFVWSDLPKAGYVRAPTSGPELHDLRTEATGAEFGAIWGVTATLTEPDPEQLRTGLVTGNFFSVLQVRPLLGRTFAPQDEGPGAAPTVLLSWPLWHRRFGGDPGIVGRQIGMNDVPTTVVGVMPREFRLMLPTDAAVPDELQAWSPFRNDLAKASRTQYYLRIVGRLKPGVSLAGIQREVDAVGERLAHAYTAYTGSGRRVYAVSLRTESIRLIRPALLSLFAGVTVLAVIAIVNAATLLLARAAARHRETAVRLALGAGRARVVRHAVSEGLMLGGLGMCVAGGVAVGVVRLLVGLKPASLDRLSLTSAAPEVVLFALGLAAVAVAVCAITPLGEVVRLQRASPLQAEQRWSSTALHYRTRAVLVTVQIALGLMLLVTAGLFWRTFAELQQVRLGFDTTGIVTVRLSVAAKRLQTFDAFVSAGRRFEEVLGRVPGVVAVGAISHVPYDDYPNWSTRYRQELAPLAIAREADTRAVSPGIFAVLNPQVIEGRAFAESDDRSEDPVVMVDERLAERTWPGKSAIGQRIILDEVAVGGRAPATAKVIGVVKHLRHRTPAAEIREQIYVPVRQTQRDPMAYALRLAPGASAPSEAAIREAIRAADPAIPPFDIRPLADYAAGAAAERRFTMLVVALFAAIALGLACAGVYGIIAFSVAKRQPEFGLRLALGAGHRQLIRTVIAEAMRLAASGAAIGVAASLAAGQALTGQLYGVTARDPLTFIVAIAVVLALAVAASWLPARRLAHVSPAEALRHD